MAIKFLNTVAVDTDVLYVDASSNRVGIGTASPSEKLDVNGNLLTRGDIVSRDTYPSIFVDHSGTVMGGIRADATNKLELKTLTTAPLSFQVNSSEKMRITSDGKVGIGTTSPSEKLDITGQYGSTTLSGHVLGFTRASANYLWAKTSGGDLRFTVNGNAIGSPSMIINPSGNVGIGTTSPNFKLQVNGGALAGGVVTYSKNYGSLDTTGNAVAGLTTSFNGASAGFTFTCFGHGGYQKVVYSCYNVSGTWNTKKVIDEGTNAFDVEASANATTITFTFKSTSGTKSYTPRVTVEATGSAINSTYA